MNIDNTKRGDYITCHRKYFYSHVKGWTPKKGKTPLRYGSTWHGMKEGFYGVIAAEGWDLPKAVAAGIENGKKVWAEETEGKIWIDDYRTLENCILAFAMWVEHFAGDEGLLKVIEPEVPFKLKLVLSKEEKILFPHLTMALDDLFFTGKIDLEIQLNGRYWVVEDKTTGQNLSIQAERLHRSTQFIGYTVASNVIFPQKPEGMLVTMHHLSAYKSKKTGLYGNPKIDFKRVPEIYTTDDFISWRQHFLATSNSIAKDLEDNIWDKNFDACFNYGRCPFYNLCAQNREPGTEILEGFLEREPWNVLKEKKPVEGELK